MGLEWRREGERSGFGLGNLDRIERSWWLVVVVVVVVLMWRLLWE